MTQRHPTDNSGQIDDHGLKTGDWVIVPRQKGLITEHYCQGRVVYLAPPYCKVTISFGRVEEILTFKIKDVKKL